MGSSATDYPGISISKSLSSIEFTLKGQESLDHFSSLLKCSYQDTFIKTSEEMKSTLHLVRRNSTFSQSAALKTN